MKHDSEEKWLENNYIPVMADSSEINTVFVVPNRASKKMTYRKLKNNPNAEIIDASSFLSTSNILAQSSLPGPKNIVRAAIQEIKVVPKVDTSACLSPEKSSALCNVDIEENCEVIFDDNCDHRITASHEINEVPDATLHKDSRNCDLNSSVIPNTATNLKSISSSIFGIYEKNSNLDEQVNEALKDVTDLNISTRRAAHIHGIKHSLLLSKMNKDVAMSSSKTILGADPALTELEELQLVNWIRSRYRKGCPVKKIDLINRVTDIVADGRSTRFKDGIPGEKWFNNFIARNPSVCTLGRSSRLDSREVPSKRSISSWFKRCLDHLQAFGKDHLLADPHSVGNVEELTLCLVSSRTDIDDNNLSSNELFLPDESSGNITVLIGACADGTLIPPMPIFSCRKPPPALINSIPSGWGIGLSKDGNINKEVVQSYFKNILIPWLVEQARLPFILFIDKLKFFLSVDISDFCAQKGLLCYNFYPNSSSVIQPLYKSVIQNIKKSWNELSQHKNDKIALLKFCPKLNDLLNEIAPPHIIIKSFKSCGIFPFSPKAPDYSNCPLNVEGIGCNRSFKSNDYAVALDVFEDTIGVTKTEIFKETLKGFKLLKAEDKGLYKVWHQIVSKVDVTRNQSMEIQDYKHEKIIRGAFRKLPRPETYLMVIDDKSINENEDENGYLCSLRSEEMGEDRFEEDEESSRQLQNDSANSILEKDSDFIYSNDLSADGDDCSSDPEEDGSPECLTSDNWKIRYQTEEKDVTKDNSRFKAERKRDRVVRNYRQLESTSNVEEYILKKFNTSQRSCSQCFRGTGKLIKCIMCKNYIHFDCMMEEEQQILSELYEDSIAFDYICPTCSK